MPQANTDKQLWSRIEKRSNGCWEWTGTKTVYGYGQFSIKRKSYRVHRLVWQKLRGDIPKGLLLCHRCDNKICCNPDHIFIGTTDDNMADMVKKGRQSHPLGTKNRLSKLDENAVKKIRESFAEGNTQEAISKQFGISKSATSMIINKKRWSHI